MPEKALKTTEKSILYSTKPVAIVDGLHRRVHRTNDANAVNRTDENITDRTAKFAN